MIVVEQKEGKLVDYYQEVREIARIMSFPHLESHHRGLLKVPYTFLAMSGGKGIGESNQELRERDKTLLIIPFILRLFATYSILLLASASTMNNKYTQQVYLRAELSQLCPAWLSVVWYPCACQCLDQPDGSCVGLSNAPNTSERIQFNNQFHSKINLANT